MHVFKRLDFQSGHLFRDGKSTYFFFHMGHCQCQPGNYSADSTSCRRMSGMTHHGRHFRRHRRRLCCCCGGGGGPAGRALVSGGRDPLAAGAHGQGGCRQRRVAAVGGDHRGRPHLHGPQFFHLHLQPSVLLGQGPVPSLQVLALHFRLL